MNEATMQLVDLELIRIERETAIITSRLQTEGYVTLLVRYQSLCKRKLDLLATKQQIVAREIAALDQKIAEAEADVAAEKTAKSKPKKQQAGDKALSDG